MGTGTDSGSNDVIARVKRERDEAVEMVRRLVECLQPEHDHPPHFGICAGCAALADAREMLSDEW